MHNPASGILSGGEFLQRYTDIVPGWLDHYAAIITLHLLDGQETRGVRGGLLEIGIYAGKYLSVLMRAAARSGDRVIGIDTFEYIPEEQVRKQLFGVPGAAELELISGSSSIFTADQLIRRMGVEARFVSIDGSHYCENVFDDFCLTEQLLSSDGIVAADDFLNPVALGVNEGIHKFFSTKRMLAPFAYTSNKLFLCRPECAKNYREQFESFIMADQTEAQSANFRQQLPLGRQHVEQMLWGWPVVLA